MKKIIEKLSQNAVIRFWVTHMIIFLLALVICIAGFGRAFTIVEENILEENQHLMSQSVLETEAMLDNIYRYGMQLSLSDAVQETPRITVARDTTYYHAVRSLLAECVDIGKYYDVRLTESSFICLDRIERVFYNGALYPQSVFPLQLSSWGISEQEYLQLRNSETTTPYLFLTDEGHLFYVFPCIQSGTASQKLGSVVFYITEELLLQNMAFLENFSSYSLFVYQAGQLIFYTDALQCADSLSTEFLNHPGTYSLEDNLVLTLSSGNTNRYYLLVLPQQETLTELSRLRLFICLLVGGAILLEAACTFFLSFRNGRSVNEMAQTLRTDDTNEYSTDLRHLNASVARVVEENRQAEPALRKSFFHNLLKASFVSKAEMNYMAKRANLTLNGSSYCAASLRLFPQIDLGSIDENTVAKVSPLLEMLEQKMTELYPGKFWSYRRNVVVSLYIMESCSDDSWDNLLQALTDILQWLEDEYQINACWGVGTPCNDLMLFWKSAEEANAMLELEGTTSKVRLYVDAPSIQDPYYLPYTIEDRLVQGIRTGDQSEVESALQIIYTENFVHRSLDHKQFQKLGARIADILSEQAHRMEQNEALRTSILELQEEFKSGSEAYFTKLRAVCEKINQQLVAEKTQLRSDKIKAILQYIHLNYSDPEMGLTMVGQQFHLSEAYLSTLFKAEVNVNFAEYLEQTRIQTACDYLRSGMLVAEVAKKTGYNSVQSFRRAFKRVMQVSPSDYRK